MTIAVFVGANRLPMKAAYPIPKILVLISIFVWSHVVKSQDYSAGINTETPNPNAVLHLVAPNGDQGLLIPTLDRNQRIGIPVTAADNGLLVFDTTDGLFYYYFNGWIALTTGTTELDGDPGNELISAGILAGNTLTITEAGIDHNIDLSAFASAPQDLQFVSNQLSLTGDPTATVVDFTGWDTNAADDLTTANVGTAANQVVQLNASGQLPAVDGSNLTGILSTVSTDGTSITGDGSGTPLAVGTVPSGQVSGLAAVATSGSFGDLLLQPVGLADGDDVGVADGTTILGNGAGTPYSVNVGTGANQILQLNASGQLPAVDGSLLTGITPTLGAGSVTTTEILDATIADIDISGTANIAATKLQTSVMLETENISLLTNDAGYLVAGDNVSVFANDAGYLTAVATDITLIGDGAGTPLSINRVNPAIIAAGGATAGQVLEFDGTNWAPAIDDGMLAATYDPTTVAGDAFAFNTHFSATAATAGDVLTFDGTSWDAAAPAGGLTLPYSQTVADAGNLFALTNSGLGGSGFFEINNALNAATALNATSNGTGSAGSFVVNNVANVGNALNASTNGTGAGIGITHSGTAGPGIDVSVGALNTTGSALNINHSGTGAGITINTLGPPLVIPGGTLGEVLTSDALGNITLQPGGITFPFSQTQANADTLFNLTNTGSAPAVGFSSAGLAATFTNYAGGTAVLIDGNMEFLDGVPRDLGILPNLSGPGDILNVYSGDAAGPGGDGGDLVLSSGLAAGIGNGGNILLVPGAGAGGGFTGGVFVNGITRFGNPNVGFGGLLELENDDGTTSIGIEADPAMAASYNITLPAAQGTGVLTNDGTGTLTWSPAGFTAPYYDDLTNVIFGTTTPVSIIPTPDFQLGAVASSGQASLSGSSHGVQSRVPLLRANGSEGSELALQAADVIGELAFVGHDGTGYFRQGMIRGFATENWTGTTRGTALSFFATPGGNTLDREVLRVSGVGLQINGIARINNPLPGFGGSIELEDDGGANSLRISADPLSISYEIIFPATQGAGALTNDGTGNLSWSGGTGAFVIDGNANLYSSNSGVAGVTGTNNFVAGATGGSLGAGNDNILIGQGAGGSLAGGSNNLFLGLNAGGASMVNSSGNVMLGANTINSDDSNNNVALGDGINLAGGEATAVGALSSATGNNSLALGSGASATGVYSVALGAGVSATQDFTAVIGDPTIPINVGIGIATPAARLEVQTFNTETTDLLRLNHGALGGNALEIDVPAGGSAEPAVILAQNSTGGGIDARITSATSGAPLISAQHQGDGNVAFFNQGNNVSGADAMFVQTLGLGAAGVFQISNTGSGAPALAVNTNGDNSNAISISKAGLNGVGILIDMNNQGSNGLLIGGTQPGVASISTDGDINTTTTFNGDNLNLSGLANIQGDVTMARRLVSIPLPHDANVQPLIPNTARIVKITNAAPSITDIDVAGAFEGQEIILIADISAPSFNIDVGGNLRLDNNSTHSMSPGASIHFVYIETLNQWVEISRSR